MADLVHGAFGNHLDPPVSSVACVPGETTPERPSTHPPSEPHALHPPTDEHGDPHRPAPPTRAARPGLGLGRSSGYRLMPCGRRDDADAVRLGRVSRYRPALAAGCRRVTHHPTVPAAQESRPTAAAHPQRAPRARLRRDSHRHPYGEAMASAVRNEPAVGSRQADEQRSVASHGRPTSAIPRLPGLDGLRALAVIAVVVFHLDPRWLPGGFLGVDVFFVVSGYLVTTILLREHTTTGTVRLSVFWGRRARRLVPALLVCVPCSVLLAWLSEPDLLVDIERQVWGAATFTSNWQEIADGADYFAATSPALLMHLWSLAVEAQFYLLWPLTLLALLRLVRRPAYRRASSQRPQAPRRCSWRHGSTQRRPPGSTTAPTPTSPGCCSGRPWRSPWPTPYAPAPTPHGGHGIAALSAAGVSSPSEHSPPVPTTRRR